MTSKKTEQSDTVESVVNWQSRIAIRVLPRLRFSNIGFFAFIFVSQLASAVLIRPSPAVILNALFVLAWAAYPCRERDFGRGQRFDWLRKLSFTIGAVIVLVVGLSG